MPESSRGPKPAARICVTARANSADPEISWYGRLVPSAIKAEALAFMLLLPSDYFIFVFYENGIYS